MGPIKAIQLGFQKRLVFSERATRSEFFWFAPGFFFLLTLFTYYGFFPVWKFFVSFGNFDVDDGAYQSGKAYRQDISIVLFYFGMFVAAFNSIGIPFSAALGRRLNDIRPRTGNKVKFYPALLLSLAGPVLLIFLFSPFNGFLVPQNYWPSGLIALFTIVCLFTLLVLSVGSLHVLWLVFLPSQPGPNKYGPNPHEVPL